MEKISTLTKEEEANPLAKYYNQEMAKVPGHILQKLNQGPLDMNSIMKYEDKNLMFDEGYLSDEIGYGVSVDGSGYAAMLTKMPGVSADMIDWWFSWHALENIRYKIWFPTAHYGNYAEDMDKLKDTTLPYQQRYQGVKQYPTENVGGVLETLVIRFNKPEDMGFDISRMKESHVPTIVCGDVGSKENKIYHTKMVHFFREIPGGLELRSRFWLLKDINLEKYAILNTVANTKFIKKKIASNYGLTISELAHNMAQHDAAEYHNLARILPELFEKYGK